MNLFIHQGQISSKNKYIPDIDTFGKIHTYIYEQIQ